VTPTRWWRDPFVVSIVVFVGFVAGGFGAIGMAWRAAARTLIVGAQVPPLVSGGLGGLALVIVGAGFAVIQVSRQAAANQRAEMEGALDEAAAVVAALRAKPKGARRA
jgi:hypothetical protein